MSRVWQAFDQNAHVVAVLDGRVAEVGDRSMAPVRRGPPITV
ncbi:hypothetical protein [Actinoplanes sp. TFC3]|nr:hypothetical protein [Actinoplanes sp. TFC3]